MDHRRKTAETIWRSGIHAVSPERLFERMLTVHQSRIDIGDLSWTMGTQSRVIVVGGGKAGAGMVLALYPYLQHAGIPSHNILGIVNVLHEQAGQKGHIRLHGARAAGDPFPTRAGVKGAEQMLELVNSARPEDLVLCLISGGASALMPCPAEGLTVEDKRLVASLMGKRGAPIHHINAVRKHLSRIKGGRLAEAGHPNLLVSLILSDVIGNPLDVIASGPTVADSSTFHEARRYIDHYELQAKLPSHILRFLDRGARGLIPETPKILPSHIHNLILGDNNTALDAASIQAKKMGYSVINLGSHLSGESRDLGDRLAQMALSIRDRHTPLAPPACILSGGETVVSRVAPGGKGGRNQELMLSFTLSLKQDGGRGITALSGGTDGEDGPTDAAGAWCDADTIAKADAVSPSPQMLLETSRSYDFFENTASLFITGPTNTNVMDLRVVLIDPA